MQVRGIVVQKPTPRPGARVAETAGSRTILRVRTDGRIAKAIQENEMTVLAISVLCVLAVPAAEDDFLTEAQAGALPRYFGFGPMQIYKLDPGIAQLQLADLDADGRTDIVLCNGYRSRLEIFYQPDPDQPPAAQPELERNEIPSRGTMRNETVPVRHRIASLRVGDLTGDGRADLVYFGEPREIVVLPGLPEGGFGPAVATRAPDGNPRGGNLALGDFNSDGRTDVALLGDSVLLVYDQREDGGLAKPERLVHGIKSAQLLLTCDLNGDGRDDLIIGADEEQRGAYVCLQQPDGSLAALRPAAVPRLRSITIADPPPAQTGSDVYSIELASGRLKHFRWGTPDTDGRRDWPQYRYSYPVKSSSKRRPLAIGDVDGDGLHDCVVIDPDAAQMILFRGDANGLAAGRAFPGLLKTSDVAIADVDRDRRAELYCASPDEKLIAVARFEDGRLSFPTPLKSTGEPYALAVGGLHVGKPADRLAYVTRNENREFELVLADPATGDELSRVEVADLDDDPDTLRFVDLDHDGRNDLLLFVRFAAPRAFVQDADGGFKRLAGPDARDWLLKETRPAAFDAADLTGDGRQEVLMAKDNLARALRVQDGCWTVVDQYNPESADAGITGLTALPDGRLVMYEQKADEILVFARRADGAYAVTDSMPVGDYDLTAMTTLPVGRSGDVAVLLADAEKLALLMPDDRADTLVERHAYETKSKEAWFADTVVGDLNRDGVRDLALVDWAKASIEIVTTLPDGGYVKAMRFQVFQGRRFSDAPDSRGEPREVLCGDVTGDGQDDIVLLVHDRLIVYPGQ